MREETSRRLQVHRVQCDLREIHTIKNISFCRMILGVESPSKIQQFINTNINSINYPPKYMGKYIVIQGNKGGQGILPGGGTEHAAGYIFKSRTHTHTHTQLIHSTQKTVVTKNKPSLIAKHDCKLSHHQIQRYFEDKEKVYSAIV